MIYPKGIHIETTGRCNSRCSFCPHSISPRRNMDMSQKLFDKIIKEMEIIPKDIVVTPFKLGEPMLDPLFSQRLLQINKQLPQAIFEIHSNLNKLPKDFIPALRQLHRVSHLWISLNEYKPEAYKETTGLDLIKTCNNITKILNANIHHRIKIGRVATYTKEDINWVDWVRKSFPGVETVLIPKGNWCDNIECKFQLEPKKPCSRLTEMSICCDGKVSLCCMDGLCEYPLGDVNNQHILEVFNSKHAIELRKLMSTRTTEPCCSCTFF